jgi:hypothetical protein
MRTGQNRQRSVRGDSQSAHRASRVLEGAEGSRLLDRLASERLGHGLISRPIAAIHRSDSGNPSRRLIKSIRRMDAHSDNNSGNWNKKWRATEIVWFVSTMVVYPATMLR